MKTLVTYHSNTGNTEKIARAIFTELPAPKEICPISDQLDPQEYDMIFVGIWLNNFAPCKPAAEFLEKRCAGKKVALFVTHACPEGETSRNMWLPGCLQAATAAQVVGVFDCVGQLEAGIKNGMLHSDNTEIRRWAEMDISQGKPDQADIERAHTFGREMMYIMA